MSRVKDIAGERFGRLVVVRDSGQRQFRVAVWECVCDCGETILVASGHLRDGHTRSCGCLHSESAASRKIDLTGRRFGRLVALCDSGERQGIHVLWEVQCDCGKRFSNRANSLMRGATQSCGCLHLERITTHGQTKGRKRGARPTGAYQSWKAMIARCTVPSNASWRWYGGRQPNPVTVCERWQGPQGFETFLIDMGERPDGTSIDRYPCRDGNYEPSNCRWATQKQQKDSDGYWQYSSKDAA